VVHIIQHHFTFPEGGATAQNGIKWNETFQTAELGQRNIALGIQEESKNLIIKTSQITVTTGLHHHHNACCQAFEHVCIGFSSRSQSPRVLCVAEATLQNPSELFLKTFKYFRT